MLIRRRRTSSYVDVEFISSPRGVHKDGYICCYISFHPGEILIDDLASFMIWVRRII